MSKMKGRLWLSTLAGDCLKETSLWNKTYVLTTEQSLEKILMSHVYTGMPQHFSCIEKTLVVAQ